LIALLLGPLLGVLAAVFSEISDRRLRTEEDLTLYTGIRLLGEVPRLPAPSITQILPATV
jgi:capsular polysaccharide biosynthesis protein